MIKLIVFAALLATAFGRSLDTKIVGGNATTIEKKPYQAALVYRSSSSLLCGGSIITTKHILTAAHCYTTSLLSVRVGSTNYNSGGQLIAVKSFKRHPNFNSNYIDNDFAVITLAEEIVLGPSVQTIALAGTNTSDPEVGSSVTVSGWGVTNETATSVPISLREADLPLVDRDVCKKVYSFLTSRQICLGGTDEGQLSACFGDSGGPCVRNGVQYALVSGGYSCETAKIPGLYARIASGREWIDETIQNNP